MFMRFILIIVCTFCLCCLCVVWPAFCADFSSDVKRPVEESISIRQATQKEEDKWAKERMKLEMQFEALEREHEQLVSTKDELGKNIALRNASIESLKNKIREISRISEELLPYLDEVYDRLGDLVASESHFLKSERQARMKNLHKILGDTQVQASEKFRKVMETLFVEAEYGNTIEVYQERIMLEGNNILVNIFRLGRIVLFFQSLDQMTTGYFDVAESIWKRLPAKYNRDINTAIEIGSKRRPVDLLSLPVGRLVIK